MKNRILFILIFFVLQGCLTVTEKELPPKIELGNHLPRSKETLVILEKFWSDIDPKLADQENASKIGKDSLRKFQNPLIAGYAKRNFASAFAQCRCFQNIVIAFKGIDDLDFLRKKYKNVIRVKLENYNDTKTVLATTLLRTFTLGLVPTWNSVIQKAEFTVESETLQQPVAFKYDRRFTLYAHIFLFFGLFNEKSVLGRYSQFYDFFQLASSEIYSQKLIPLDD
ncbi:putative lipoprotein [Leptospira weilii str. Ecochallenge]|uniref:Putative lipoprotein n=1 Tax=Leptospira weilii str. Ecochallenge TaxID=1049986 RepID=N1U826_9LEPT|nr:putative lipoprotein [Leptospira weilii str. Ecochallenge]